jgi:hypothetical protein
MKATRQRRKKTHRYVAKLLFQFRVVVDGVSNRRRLCEIMFILIRAANAEAAYRLALKRGRTSQYSYKDVSGNPIHFEFVGVLEMLRLGVECLPDEVWYDLKRITTPKERAKQLIPPKRKLNAFVFDL